MLRRALMLVLMLGPFSLDTSAVMPSLMLSLMLMSGLFSLNKSAVMPSLKLMLIIGPVFTEHERCYASAYAYAYVGPVFTGHQCCYAYDYVGPVFTGQKRCYAFAYANVYASVSDKMSCAILKWTYFATANCHNFE